MDRSAFEKIAPHVTKRRVHVTRAKRGNHLN